MNKIKYSPFWLQVGLFLINQSLSEILFTLLVPGGVCVKRKDIELTLLGKLEHIP
jgi:hypothetical protein